MKKVLAIFLFLVLLSGNAWATNEWSWGNPDLSLTLSTGADGWRVANSDNGNRLTGNTTLNAATGNQIAYQLSYTTNKATSGNDTGLLVSMTDTASPGTSYVLDLQVGASSKFSVNQAGNTTIGGTLTLGSGGDIAVNTNKFTVTASSGNTLVAGTLSATGNFAVNTDKFTANATSGDTVVGGALTVTTTKTDGIAFIPAVNAYTLYAGTAAWSRVLIRAAAGDWGVQQTSGNNDNTMQIAFPIGNYLRRTTASKGIKITGFKVAHSITNAQDLGATTVTLKKAVYSTSANAITDMPVTGSLSVTKNANYLDVFAVTTPYWMVDANADFVIDIAIAATTSGCVWKVYGVYVTYEIATY